MAGNYANRALKSGCSWKVLAVFRQGFYCQSSFGELIFVGSHSIRPGPLNVMCRMPGPVNWVAAGLTNHAVVQSEREAIRIDNRFEFTLSNIQCWQPEDISNKWNINVVAERINILSEETDRRELADGLGSFVRTSFNTPFRPETLPSSLMKMAWKSAARIQEWLNAEFSGKPTRISDIQNEIRTLIGLGPGLTPAGDDFLGGILITLSSLGRGDLAKKMAGGVLSMARLRTGKISFAHLFCAAGGQGHEILHHAIAALSVKRKTGLKVILRELDAVGHTSGWDALAGVALVLKALLAAKGMGHSDVT
ncbi:MAG: DUF2877 domain-containing protein [Thermodesulfobacteriota bacterium]